ncbi:bifunctional riboflavin kinase/FAD synthetase [Nocardia sp. NPDC049220]|uniref:bifunctional riboflavin kinase/FAD synthetase n=1 Tax=Nocardia sp. NPDC049220 TaxID=3155273 RepID=UPI003404B3D2
MTQPARPSSDRRPSRQTLWRRAEDVPADLGPTVVAIGHFDGVHRGHQRLLADAEHRARALGLPVGAVTFDRHPATILTPGRQPAVLTGPDRKFELLAHCGLDFVLALPMNLPLLTTSAEDFATDLLATRLRVRSVSVGENFRYGYRAAGDISTLHATGRRLGFEAHKVDLLTIDGSPVSSTRIRAAVAEGRVRSAITLLGRSHSVEAIVATSSGRQATARTDPEIAEPALGSYRAAVYGLADPTQRTEQRAQVTVHHGALSIEFDHEADAGWTPVVGTKLRVEFVDEIS